MTYYLLKWKENLKTETSVTTPTFLSTGSRHTAASAQPYTPNDSSVWKEITELTGKHRCGCDSVTQSYMTLE